LAHDIKTLSTFDPYLLNDIGMDGFDRLPPALQERALLNWSKHSSRI
jgi:hypothetical protein